MDFVCNGLWGDGRTINNASALGFVKSDRLVFGAVYHNWHQESGVIEVSAYSTRRDWLTRAALKEIFAYPFDGLGCRVVVARHSEKNKIARRVWDAFGATQTSIPDLHADGVAEVVAVLKRADWQSSKFMRQ